MTKRKILLMIILCSLAGVGRLYAQDDLNSVEVSDDINLELLEANDQKMLEGSGVDLNLSDVEETDDYESLKNDIGNDPFQATGEVKKKETPVEEKKTESYVIQDDVDLIIEDKSLIVNQKEEKKEVESKKPEIFDVGNEEKKLLEISKFLETKIPDVEWEEISTNSKEEKYVVQQGDWLWKISERLFGSGFYYSKIWSMNPHITNPHEIEPGMILTFRTGTSDEFPNVELGNFEEVPEDTKLSKKSTNGFNIDSFADDATPEWLTQRQKLIDQGVFFQFASEETFDDLRKIGEHSIRTEYEKYEPPVPDIVITEPGEEYDETGLDKSSKIEYKVKEGFFLNTFVTTNVVQDLGKVDAKRDESIFIKAHEKVYVEFDKGVKVKPGDMFSIYSPEGKASHSISDRSGYKYDISAQIKVLRKQNHLWECLVTDLIGIIERGARITVYTPKIEKIFKTFNKRAIEAAIMDTHRDTANGISFGDVVYIDRGRADGVEIGNVFEIFSFEDKGTGKRITPDPTYKIGELSVVTLTDNFATAIITNSSVEIPMGSLALAKTEEQVLKERQLKSNALGSEVSELEKKSLDELDVELNLDNMGKDLLEQVDKLQLTEDELQELERQEREKSVIKEHERDMQELDRLEGEILDAEKSLNEARVDEDKFLEQQNLDAIENNQQKQDPDAYESLNDIEQEVGRKYLDQDLNEKENPYGLTEFDLEEVDELLNTDQ